MNNDIEQLALQKDFTALSPAERSQVLAEMPREAYEQLRRILLAARQMEADAAPPAHLRNQLLSHMADQAKPTTHGGLWTVRVPLWQAAAVMVLGIATTLLFRKDVVVEKIVTHTQVQADTIYREKMLWRDRVVVRNQVVYLERPVTPPVAQLPGDTVQSFTAPDLPSMDLPATAIGVSLEDTPEWMSFFTQGDQ